MKAYALDLRERVVKFLQAGGSKVEAARRFDLGTAHGLCYLAAAKAGQLAPKTSWGKWRKLDPQKLTAHVQKQPDATLKENRHRLGHQPQRRLGAVGETRLHFKKKLIKYASARGATLALPARVEKFHGQPVFYLDECGVAHRLYREYAGTRGERIYAACRASAGNAPASSPLPPTGQACRPAGVSRQLHHGGGGRLF